MNKSRYVRPTAHTPSWGVFWVRIIVGGFFIYTGLVKALEPAEFLKLFRAYDLTNEPLALNMVAALLPWFEVYCGVLLVFGVAVRGTAFLLVLMLTPFTAVVLHRALEIQEATNLAFCAVRFDCGCGTGEVTICRKLAENAVVIVLGIWLAVGRKSRLTLAHRVA